MRTRGTTEALAFAGVGLCELIKDGAFTVQNNVLGIGVRGATHYARATNGTVLAERTPSGRFNYLYDGYGSVVGLTNSAGNLTVSYRYDPYGHPMNLQSQGNENPFGYLGGYALGLGSGGVLCGGPGHFGCTPYDGENGRSTSPQNPPDHTDSNPYTAALFLPGLGGGDPVFVPSKEDSEAGLAGCASGGAVVGGFVFVFPVPFVVPIIGAVGVVGGAGLGCVGGAISSVAAGVNIVRRQ